MPIDEYTTPLGAVRASTPSRKVGRSSTSPYSPRARIATVSPSGRANVTTRHNHLVAQSDPLRLSYSDEREEFYAHRGECLRGEAVDPGGSDLDCQGAPEAGVEALEKLRKETADDPEYQALPGTSRPSIARRMAIGLRSRRGTWSHSRTSPGASSRTLSWTTDRARPTGSSPWRPGWEGSGRDSTFPRRASKVFRGCPCISVRSLVSRVRGVKHLVAKAIRLESQKSLKEVHAYGHTGWIEVDGRWVYLHADGAIVGAGAPPFPGRVVLSGKLARRRFPEEPF